MSLLVRELRPADKELFAEMACDFFAHIDVMEPLPREHFYGVFDDLLSGQYSAQGYLLCDGADGPVVGFTVWCFFYTTQGGRPVVWLEDLYIKPQFRGQDWGSQVMAELEKRHPQARIRLETWPSNTGAQRFYERHGYEQSELLQYMKDLD